MPGTHGRVCRQEIFICGQIARFDSRQLERVHTDRSHCVVFAGLEQRVPQRFGFVGREPELVAEIARETRTRDHEFGAIEVEVHQAEQLEFLEAV